MFIARESPLNTRYLVLTALMISVLCSLHAQELSPRPANSRPTVPSVIQEPNTDPTYKTLRSIGTGDLLAVRDAVLKRDAATFSLTGTLTFLAPVHGKVTGAVFFGHGTLAGSLFRPRIQWLYAKRQNHSIERRRLLYHAGAAVPRFRQ